MSSRLLASLPRLSPLRGGLLQGRVHQSLWLEMLVAATAASALTAIAAGAVVLFHERSHLAVESEQTQRELSVSLTSYEPLYNLQRRLQQATSGRQVEMALVVSEQGRVLAASNNALVGLPMALAVVDVDRFKGINDSRGHDAGDRVIERVAELLRAAVQGADLVGRLGGDEFVILLQLSGEAGTATLGRILESVRRAPIVVDGGPPLGVTLSVGVATREGEADTTLADLLAAADAALYVAKDRGRDRVVNLELEAQQSAIQAQRADHWRIERT